MSGGRLFVNVPPDGRAHWVVYKQAGADPEYPWFVEHRIVPEGHPRHEHDDRDDYEYGSWSTFEHAIAAVIDFSTGGCLTENGERVQYINEGVTK
jgi:hypothetical protein